MRIKLCLYKKELCNSIKALWKKKVPADAVCSVRTQIFVTVKD